MSDELLRGVHVFQQLLQKLVREAFLHGGRVLLHVLQTPGRKHSGTVTLSPHVNTRVKAHTSAPADGVSVDLEEAEEILRSVSVLGFFFGCERVVRHQQRMRSSCT